MDKIVKKLMYEPLFPVAAWEFLSFYLRYGISLVNSKWQRVGWKKPDQSEIETVET